jgi:hypothetical protein
MCLVWGPLWALLGAALLQPNGFWSFVGPFSPCKAKKNPQ